MALPATDSFTRADNASLGANWTNVSGGSWTNGHKVASNRADCSVFDVIQASIWTADAFAADQYSQAAMVISPFSAGLVLRMTADGAQGYLARGGAGHGAVTLHVLSSAGLAAAFATLSANFTTNDVLKFTVTGTSFEVFVNGVSIGTGTDSTYTSGGSAGIYGRYSGNDGHDDWEGGTPGGAPAGGQPYDSRTTQIPGMGPGGSLVSRGGGRIFGRTRSGLYLPNYLREAA